MRTLGIVFLLLVSFACMGGQEPCKFGYGSEKSAGQLETALKQAPTCERGAAILSKCWWGSSADVGFASIVIEKCEKALLPKLNRMGKERYQRERELCTYEFAAQDGSLFLSEEAMCALDVVRRFGKEPALAELPSRRASFDCAKAATELEKAICSDDKLGRADIVLERAYRPLLRSTSPEQRPHLIRQQSEWRKGVERICNVGTKPLTSSARECVRKEFEARFTELDACSVAGPEECLRKEPDNQQ